MRPYTILASVLCVLLHAASGAGQDRGLVSIDAALQTTATKFSSVTTFTEFVEEGRITTAQTIAKGPVYGGGVTVRAWRNLVLGAAVSYYSKATSAQVDAELPHPFEFAQPRLASATASGLKRSELGTHLLIGVILAATDRMELIVSGGPSIFRVQQDLVSGVTYNHTYPYDEVEFTGVTTARLNGRAVGYHVGADVTMKLSRHLGLGGLLRFTRGKLKSTVDSDAVSFDVGGLHAGGGLRFFF